MLPVSLLQCQDAAVLATGLNNRTCKRGSDVEIQDQQAKLEPTGCTITFRAHLRQKTAAGLQT